MNDPAVLFYTSDFLTGVIDMSMEERGQYITLLCYQHQKGHIKEETIRLLVGSCSVNVLCHFKKDENGYYFNQRMDDEKEKRRIFTDSRRENGKKGGRPKKPNDKPKENLMDNLVDNHMGNLMGNDNDNDNNNINDNDNIYQFIENNFGRTLSPIEYEKIAEWEDNELTRYAIKQAVLNNKYNIKYIDSILQNYKINHIFTIQEAQERDKEYKESKNKKYNKSENLTHSQKQNKLLEALANGQITVN